MKYVKTLLYKISYKLKQYFQGYILRRQDALLALDFIKKDRKFDFRHRYKFEANPVIFDCGGFKGEWTARMLKLYRDINPKIYVFEIAEPYIKYLERRFQRETKVQVFPFGLGKEDCNIEFSVSELATSIYLPTKEVQTEIGNIRSIQGFLEEAGIEKIDLLKMNIEGGEYDLLDSIISSGFVKKCKNIQIQFHNYGEWSIIRRDKIKEQLKRTHVSTYDYEWTFENWELK